MKPNIFIGCSVESLEIAYEIQSNLEYHFEPTVWDQGIFKPSSLTITSLLEALDNFDFAVFVFSPDDITQIRSHDYKTIRDNIILEFGLFIGKLGLNRVFFIKPRDIKDFHLPTDLLGITPLSYDASRKDGNLKAALGPACNEIVKHSKHAKIVRLHDQNISDQVKHLRNLITNQYNSFWFNTENVYVNFITKKPKQSGKDFEIDVNYVVQNIDKYVNERFITDPVTALIPNPSNIMDIREVQIEYSLFCEEIFKKQINDKISELIGKYITIIPKEVAASLYSLDNLLKSHYLITSIGNQKIDFSKTQMDISELKNVLKSIGEEIIKLK